MRRMLSFLLCMMLVLTSCGKSVTKDIEGKALYECGINIEQSFGDAIQETFTLPRFHGLRQEDMGVEDRYGKAYGPSAKGTYTKIVGLIFHRSQLDGYYPDIGLMELHAYSKDDVNQNFNVYIGEKSYTFNELEPYLVLVTNEYYVYDFMFVDSEKTPQEYYFEKMVQQSEGYYSDEEQEEYVQLLLEARQWLQDELKQGV